MEIDGLVEEQKLWDEGGSHERVEVETEVKEGGGVRRGSQQELGVRHMTKLIGEGMGREGKD